MDYRHKPGVKRRHDNTIWLGTTTENQAEADRRIPVLLARPARIRFICAKPLLEPV
jgi:protein gp37